MTKMTEEEAKNFLSTYEDTLSYKRIAECTGYSVLELIDMYDELLSSKELFARKNNARKIRNSMGIVKINPITFETHWYKDREVLMFEGYSISNILHACDKLDCLCQGSLWRFAAEIDLHNVKRTIKEQLPELYKPIISIDRDTKEQMNYSSVFMAVAVGYNKTEIVKAITNNSVYKGKYWKYNE